MEGNDSPSDAKLSRQRPKPAESSSEHEGTEHSEEAAPGQRCVSTGDSGVDSDSLHPDNIVSNAAQSMPFMSSGPVMPITVMPTIEQAYGDHNKYANPPDNAGETSDDSARSKGRPSGESQSELVALENSDIYNKETVSQHDETSHTGTMPAEPKCHKKVRKRGQHNPRNYAVSSDDSSPSRSIDPAPRSDTFDIAAHMNLDAHNRDTWQYERLELDERCVVPFIPTGLITYIDGIEPLFQDDVEENPNPYVLHYPPIMRFPSNIHLGDELIFLPNNDNVRCSYSPSNNGDPPGLILEVEEIIGPEEDDEPHIENG